MAGFGDYLADGRSVLADHPRLAAVPLASSLLAVDRVVRVASTPGRHFSVSFPLPTPVVDLWTFVQAPQNVVNSPFNVLLFLVLAVVNAALAAGFLGALRDALVGRSPEFAAGVRRYVWSLLGYQLLAAAALLVTFLFVLVVPPLVILVFPVLLFVGYLFFGAPYLVVAEDRALLPALERSYELAAGGGSYFGFAVGFLLVGTALSVVASLVVLNLGIVGVLVGSAAAAPAGVVFGGATMAMVLDVSGGEAGDPDGAAGDDSAGGRPVEDGPATPTEPSDSTGDAGGGPPESDGPT